MQRLTDEFLQHNLSAMLLYCYSRWFFVQNYFTKPIKVPQYEFASQNSTYARKDQNAKLSFSVNNNGEVNVVPTCL